MADKKAAEEAAREAARKNPKPDPFKAKPFESKGRDVIQPKTDNKSEPMKLGVPTGPPVKKLNAFA